MSEELELVTSFDSLQASDLVVVKHRAGYKCNKKFHRQMLISFSMDPAEYYGDVSETGGWNAEPTPSCCAARGYSSVIGIEHVAERRLYRVIIPPVQEAQETSRPKKLERIR